MVYYLDNNASTKSDPAVVDAMMPWLDGTKFGNPHAGHFMGAVHREAMDVARMQILDTMCLSSSLFKCIFTSSASESNNMAVKGAVFAAIRRNASATIVCSPVEHGSVDGAIAWLVAMFKIGVIVLPVDAHGVVELNNVKLPADTCLVTCIHTVAETGAVQPVAALGALVRSQCPEAVYHVDAAQSVGKLMDLTELGCADLITVAAHKFHGPKGVGALVVRNSAIDRIDPLIHGAGQEYGLRGGSENVAFIVGIGEAADRAKGGFGPEPAQALWKTLSAALVTAGIDHRLNSTAPNKSPSTINFSVAHLNGPAVVSKAGRGESPVCFSAGSACHSRGGPTPSKVLEAMNLELKYAASGLRLSINKHMTVDEAVEAGNIVANILIDFR